MFCPNCRMEYRTGFTKCADCGVDLVAVLPTEDLDVTTDADGLELLWSGMTGDLHGRIESGLDDAHIFHKGTSQKLQLSLWSESGVNFIWIDPKDRAASRAILEEILASAGTTSEEAETNTRRGRFHFFGENSANYGVRRVASNASADNAAGKSDELSESDDDGGPTPDDVVEDFYEEDATTEAWAGDDREMADYLKMCLSGVGIGCVIGEGGGKLRMLVMPGSEKRAKEIVREVVEGTPPQ